MTTTDETSEIEIEKKIFIAQIRGDRAVTVHNTALDAFGAIIATGERGGLCRVLGIMLSIVGDGVAILSIETEETPPLAEEISQEFPM